MSQDQFKLSSSSYDKMMNVVDESKQHQKYFGAKKNNNVMTHNIIEGRNTFRISPGLNEGGVPYMPIRYSLMNVEVDEYNENGEMTGEKKWVLKRCYVATQHGPRKNGESLIKKDPIEFYIESVMTVCRKTATSEQEYEKNIAPIRGYRDQSGKYVWGIQPFTRIVCYAWDLDWKLGRLELYSTWFEQMKSINAVENINNKTPYDVFSDSKNGSPIVIDKTVTKTANRTKTDYAISQLQLDKNTRESWDEFFERYQINEARIEDLKDVKPLESLYWESYTLNHFYRVKKALKRFDEKYGYDLFEKPIFSSQWDRLEAHIKQFVKEEEQPQQQAASSSSNKEETLMESIAKVLRQPYEKLSTEEVENVLKNYAIYKHGPDVRLPQLSTTEYKIWYKIAQKGQDLPLDINNNDDDLTDDLPF
jgi:hypothetical protein